ncbi:MULTISPECIES: hypothetical protein [Aquimarina]|nr:MULTISPECIES: hypothetical protein [Aquimarina]
MYFIAIGYCYLLFPVFLSKLSDQLTLKVREGEIIDIYSVWDESTENYEQKVIVKTVIVSGVTQEIDQSPYRTYTIGDSIKLAYNEEKDKLIEVSLSSKITSSLFIISCLWVLFIIICSILYILNFLSGKTIIKKTQFLALKIFLPFIFLSIITICIYYIIKLLFGITSSENRIIYSLLSIFFLILFSWVSWAYRKVIIEEKK